MVCRKCGADIPDGDLFCPVCGAEVQLVADYNSVEYLLNQQLRKNQQEQKEKKHTVTKPVKKRSAGKIVLITLLVLFGCAVLALSGKYYIDSRNKNDYSYQMQMAQQTFDEKNYSDSIAYVQQALRLKPDSLETKLLEADILMAQKDDSSAEQILRSVIGTDPGNLKAYGNLISIYEAEGKTDTIKNLMDSCKDDGVLSEYAAYICDSPVFSPAEGSYKTKIKISINAQDNCRIFYTTDGSDPTESSMAYTGEITASEGRNEIRAIAVNEKGIKSNVSYHIYTVVLARPDSPAITPVSGEYTAGTKITVTVPSGCKAYYAFDSTPTITGKSYSGPVEMPSGTHIFSVILQDENGKISVPASETYVVNG